MLRMRGHVSAGFSTVTSYSCKVNAMVFVILLQVLKVNLMLLLV